MVKWDLSETKQTSRKLSAFYALSTWTSPYFSDLMDGLIKACQVYIYIVFPPHAHVFPKEIPIALLPQCGSGPIQLVWHFDWRNSTELGRMNPDVTFEPNASWTLPSQTGRCLSNTLWVTSTWMGFCMNASFICMITLPFKFRSHGRKQWKSSTRSWKTLSLSWFGFQCSINIVGFLMGSIETAKLGRWRRG